MSMTTAGSRLMDDVLGGHTETVAAQATTVPVAHESAATPKPRPAVPWAVARSTVFQARAAAFVRHAEGRSNRITGPKGSRVWTASSLSDHGIPSAALRAYKSAARTMAKDDPGCQIPWTLIAGIGRVESDHGRYGGSVLGSDGVSRPLIIGVPLNGKGPVAAVHDTDNGVLDKDKVWDRAVGPMQFIPSTWAQVARDGDGDGVSTPNDIDDAALGTAAYLCAGSGSILSTPSMRSAIFRYNPSDYYVDLVLAFQRGYRTGVFVMPSPPPVAVAATHPKKKHHKHRDHAAAKHALHARAKPRKGKAKPAAKPHATVHAHKQGHRPRPKPSPAPTPPPTSSPSAQPTPKPTLVAVSGSLSSCGAGWCLDGSPLDLGPGAQLGGHAAHDYDGDGAVETGNAEIAGLVGTGFSMTLKKGTNVVYTINGLDYRFADGTFA